MTRLHEIRTALVELKRRRRLIRWGTALAALAVSLVVALLVIFALDVAFQSSVVQRVALLLVATSCVIWAMRRFVFPFLGVQESESDLALFVERQHGIDTDLVAALQFSRPEATLWGSQQLETAVIERISEQSTRLDVFRGLQYEQLGARLKLFAVTVIVVAVVTLLYPQHVNIFCQRLFLSSRPYPSDTKIESARINDLLVLSWDPLNRTPQTIPLGQGSEVRFVVDASGDLPDAGAIRCFSSQANETRSLELRKLSSAEQDRMRKEFPRSTSAAQSQLYLATLPQLLEDFDYSIRLGDTETEPGKIRMIELPIVEADLQITPPDYARTSPVKPATSRQVAVMEASTITLVVRSLNHKVLRSVWARISQGDQRFEFSLSKHDQSGMVWQLNPDKTPLEHVQQELRYEIQVVDEHGFSLESPLQGMIQLTPDRLPMAFAHTVHRVVLPGARPIVEFRVTDDYGIQAVRMQTQVERLGNSSADPATSQFDVPIDPRPLIGASVRYRGTYELDLAPLKLAKGDRLKLTLETIDYRGSLPGKSYLTEPLLLEVTDEAGVLAAITEVDEQSEQRLSETIEQQLGVGTTP